MRNLYRASILACLLTAWVVSVARAQTMAASFDQLDRVLRVGDVVYVVDNAGMTTWGRVDQLTESSLTLAVMAKAPDRAGVLITAERRLFTEDGVSLITRSDAAGREGAPVYPPSWDRVHELPPDADVSIVLDTGDRRSYRFGSADADTLRLFSSASGREETIEKARVRRVDRQGVDDSTRNGLILGALAGAGAMLAVTAAMYAQCDAGCDAPAYSEMFPVSIAFGAGVGAAAGWLLDRIHKGTGHVFPAPPIRSPRVGVSPVLSGHRRGLRVSIAF